MFISDKIKFEQGVLLRNNSHYKIGGPARYFFEAKNVEEIIEAVKIARQKKLNVFVLAGGTNILFSDDGFDGLILKPNIQFIKKDGNSLRVGAGVLIADLLNYLIINSLSGLEWTAGLPGTVGGAVRGNAGCFGGEIKDVIKEVTSLDIFSAAGKIIKRSKDDCGFNYRSSVFKINNKSEIIVEAVLALKEGDKELLQKVSEQNINYRKENQPLEYPSIGSVFKNVNCDKITESQRKKFKSIIKTDPFPVVPAAYLISEAGLKGVSYGGAMISPKHPNFIVNVLNATSQDVKSLIFLAKNEVKTKFGITLEEEVEVL